MKKEEPKDVNLDPDANVGYWQSFQIDVNDNAIIGGMIDVVTVYPINHLALETKLKENNS